MLSATTSPTHPPSDLLDPTSAAYKKARRQYWKTTHNRRQSIDADWTPFRAAEKKYKSRFPPPDLSGVLDVAVSDKSRADEVERGGWRGRSDAVRCREIELKLGKSPMNRKAYIFPGRPGLVLLPSFVPPEEQRRLVRWSLCEQARSPNETNLDAHYFLPEQGLWNKYVEARRAVTADECVVPRAIGSSTSSDAVSSCGPRQLISNEPVSKENYATIASSPKPSPVPSASPRPMHVSELVPKLRWANIGWFYHWGSKQYDFTRGRGAVGGHIASVCKAVVEAVPWDEVFLDDHGAICNWSNEGPDWSSWTETYEPDAGIVNFYQTKDTLMAHVDRSEVNATSPLVSVSLGCAAVFLIGGLTRDVEPIPILLRSGDVVIMSGPACRRAYHGVPRILEYTLPPHLDGHDDHDDWELYKEYLHTTRININVRQVFPKDFDPFLKTSC
ncbi:hypothetical protein B0H21DRAFT_781123 [Amylocystis lapponica]|nr:hypothetical protein B0H21DRAFT_781123 [Amylocystis lapponica]